MMFWYGVAAVLMAEGAAMALGTAWMKRRMRHV